jgi:hypothetical protein
MKHTNYITRRAALILLCVMLNGCATPAQPQQMMAQSISIPRIDQTSPLYHAIVIVKVHGGEETNPLLTSKVGDKELEQALRESMRQHGFLSESIADAPYRLEVFLVDLKQPLSGYTLIVDSFIRYKLNRTGDGNVIYDDIITASDKATVDDAFYGPNRLKIANERSIRANITSFMERLYSLKVPQSTSR